MSDDEVVQLLRESVRLLRVIARPHIRELEERFAAGMLTSAKRKAMWHSMDGSKTLGEIATEAGTSSEAVRQFVREVEDTFPDLIEIEAGAGPQKPRRTLIQ